MRVLLTGSAGFIGSHIAEALLADGHDVRGLDARPSQGGFESGIADVQDPAAVARCLDGVDAVCHQAAMVGLGVNVFDLPAYAAANVHGTAVLLAEMARAGVGTLVFASSMVVYGEGSYSCARHGSVRPGPRTAADLDRGSFEPPCPLCGAPLEPGTVSEEAPVDPRNAYADTKVAQEHLAASWARATGGRVAALRYHNVFGPRMPRDTPYAGVAAIFRSCLERGEAPRVFEDGGQRRDFVHVRDVARANVLALRALERARSAALEPATGAEPTGTEPTGTEPTGTEPAGAEPTTGTEPVCAGALRAYNIASGRPRTVGDLARALAEVYGGPEPVVVGGHRVGDVRHIVAAPHRAADELGFTARIPFTEGIAEFAKTPQPA